MTTEFHVISHTHWDREWYQCFEHFRLRLVDLMDRLLDIFKTDPTYVFHLDAQTVCLEDYLEVRPQRRTELEELVRAGRLLVGPWYVQNDFNLCSGEATVRNLLILAGPGPELERLLETVRIFDVDWLEGMSVALFTPDFVDAETLSDELKIVFGENNESPLAGLIQFVSLERLNALLVITSRPQYLEKVAEWVERLDRDTGEERWTLQLGGPTWSSPVIVDDVWIQGDCAGVLRAYDVSDTQVEPPLLWELSLGGCIESTPAVWNGTVVVGTRAGWIFAVADVTG